MRLNISSIVNSIFIQDTVSGNMGYENYVVFVDVMGFADGLEMLTDGDNESLANVSLDRGGQGLLSGRAREIAEKYVTLHKSIETIAHLYSWRVDTAILFSDSAFIVIPDRHTASQVAIDIMQKMYCAEVPARIGIGKGSFFRLPFSTISDPDGIVLVKSPFMGTGIVRAYRAQSSGSLGFRIFLHPSAVDEVSLYRWIYVELTDSERNNHAWQELNFLDRPPYGDYPVQPVHTVYQHFQNMMKENFPNDNPRVEEHYKATQLALERLKRIADDNHYEPTLPQLPYVRRSR
jgi:hypothetical protein